MNAALKPPVWCTGVRLSIDSPYRHNECDHCKRHLVPIAGETPLCFLAPIFVADKCPMRVQR